MTLRFYLEERTKTEVSEPGKNLIGKEDAGTAGAKQMKMADGKFAMNYDCIHQY